ncbi:enoyl-CoA hydratase/isomerase family protein [Myxococcus landrumensis]|uniref:Enoyl-CoA hydratase/isomerase family protein n=1 Tax=Myxococcus landrumensis TaxID=2813577 RepID=A0ABX7NEV1_9BACT|nr:enoyl-CoA hydratase/isomerase family protein [Myxococcus landrumus]QSQ16024.1 enoyl-CoA hydratase/isomerase family protein [Myxococcus landrumus]
MTDPNHGVLLEVAEGVATLTLNDAPRRNAMTPELGDALRVRVSELRGREDVRAVVLVGAGGTFSAGGDLQMLERLRKASFEEARVFMLDFYARYLSLLDLTVPTVAAVEGAAIGAGLCVALACDVCIVSEDAKLALNFVQLGLHPGMGATWLVPMRAGPQRAAELLLTGRRFDGREAARLGLALEATAATETRARALALARSIASNAPLATRGVKQRLGLDRAALQRALEEEARLQAESYGSADLGEGLAAAAARRPPVFQGR